ncbi:MAG: hypothetical protein DLM67_09330 [Candidatus Nephthysia bennettiae]|uniref:DUF971 domain-containing protein n=1 Tax=Candidatus Nephthysia bennettiae TaxID=3127016 RepID=A0A934N7I7_9BACT|nr:DUF971 domain-containing protein [Candidatus Dormibacteraeota bacterium]MBJ7613594.1 DUF971 domain-containing protein [Candidatus Dormibacteraeota bacterium]PZR96632.1 MAG: hypothetical protein DLM67_09330 [Candidatus Dormibacteraeota bacterium]
MKQPDSAQPFPVSVDLIRDENLLVIIWDDHRQSRFGGAQLRWACPCAECRGEAGVPGRLDRAPSLADAELKLADVMLVGQYALQVAFESGHATGIYTFRHLRSLGISD